MTDQSQEAQTELTKAARTAAEQASSQEDQNIQDVLQWEIDR
jgi:hypothetical protein